MIPVTFGNIVQCQHSPPDAMHPQMPSGGRRPGKVHQQVRHRRPKPQDKTTRATDIIHCYSSAMYIQSNQRHSAMYFDQVYYQTWIISKCLYGTRVPTSTKYSTSMTKSTRNVFKKLRIQGFVLLRMVPMFFGTITREFLAIILDISFKVEISSQQEAL